MGEPFKIGSTSPFLEEFDFFGVSIPIRFGRSDF